MKTLAIIGTSNSVMRNGYGDFTKRKLKNECDIFGIGSSTSLLGVITILQAKILGFYKYVVLEFNINETDCLNDGTINSNTLIAYWMFILHKFKDSCTIPLILILPYRRYHPLSSASYIARAMALIFDVKIIDIEAMFIYIDDRNYSRDGAHAFPLYQDFISHSIINSLNGHNAINNIDIGKINFSLFNFTPPDNYNLKKVIKGTSLITNNVYLLEEGLTLKLPEVSYICGIIYWTEEINPWLIISNNALRICKNINIANFKRLYLCRSIGYSFFNGLSNTAISCSFNNNGNYCEQTSHEDNRLSENKKDQRACLYLNAILLCDKPPARYGQWFYNQHRSAFDKARGKVTDLHLNRRRYECESSNLDEIAPGLGNLFHNVLQTRPDLYQIIDNQDFMAEKLLLWGWINGRKEMQAISDQESVLEQGLRSLANTPSANQLHPGYTKLAHAIWLARDDLRQLDTDSKEGQAEFVRWLKTYGIGEMELDGIVR